MEWTPTFRSLYPEPANLPQMLSAHPKTLHETVLRNFNRTPDGKIYENDVKDIFSIMVICLDLKPETRPKFGLSFGKPPAYMFSVQRALEAMQNLKLDIDLPTITTTISYSIKDTLGMALITKFFSARLLHCPSARTRREPRAYEMLQPTPKGVAVLHDFCKKVGMKSEHQPHIVRSVFNSMEVFKYYRNSVTDRILYSDYFLYLLFGKLLGPRPNVWSPENGPDRLLLLGTAEENTLDANHYSFVGAFGDGFALCQEPASKLVPYAGEPSEVQEDSISPFHHRYFTNPESDSHVQYYVSGKGVRVFKNKVFWASDGTKTAVHYCISGKAIVQWLGDCTDVMSDSHSVEIAQLLLDAKLLSPVTLLPSTASSAHFSSDRTSFYVPSDLGKRVSQWKGPRTRKNRKNVKNSDYDNIDMLIDTFCASSENSGENEVLNSAKVPALTIREIIKDPGMRYLFKSYLEQGLCSENLDAYLQLKQYEKQIKALGVLLKLKRDANHAASRLDAQISSLASACSSTAYHIFFTYLSAESPFVLNINYLLRQQITSVMVSSNSPENEDHAAKYLETPVSIRSFDLGVSDQNSVKSSPVLNETKVEDTEADLGAKNSPSSNSGHFSASGGQVLLSHSSNGSENVLVKLDPITASFSEILKHIYRLMEEDSLPKFLSSELFKTVASSIDHKTTPAYRENPSVVV